VVVDKISSLIFTFAFLIIFFLVSVGLYLASFLVIGQLFDALLDLTSGLLNDIFTVVVIVVILAYFISGIIYMIDFLTLGALKRAKEFRKYTIRFITFLAGLLCLFFTELYIII
jgi:hypothetical protein